MSAYFAVAYPDRVEILMDGACYSDDGTLIDVQSKIWTSGYLPIGFAGRGNSSAVNLIGSAIGAISFNHSFDETVLRFAEKLATTKSRDSAQNEVDGIIVGISETRGPSIFMFHTYRNAAAGEHYEPWTLYDAGEEFLGAPCPTPQEFKASGLPMHWACDGLAEHGATFFRLLRSQQAWRQHPDAPKSFWGIGGHVEHTVIQVSGAETKRLHEWPDRIGEKLNAIQEAA
ncbi:MAG: hypothetical protein WBA85_05960 [Brucella anthropi]